MSFPKCVYRRGTGKKVNDDGLYTAQSEFVASAEHLAALGPGWCDSPVEAATSEAKPDAKQDEKPAKKAKAT